MDAYAIILYSLSSFGFFIIIFSLYLLITVPTKLTPFTRFVIHGHDLVSGVTQLYMTIGLQTHVILPCASGYNAGILTHFKVMRTLTQDVILVALITTNASFSLLLTINRAFALLVRLSDKTKNLILVLFFLQLIAQLIGIVIVGSSLTDSGEKGRIKCKEKIKEYPKEMDTMDGVNFMFFDNKEYTVGIIYIVLYTIFYMAVASVFGTVLVRSILNQGKLSQSVQFLTNQRRITVGIIYFGIVEIVGVGGPIAVVTYCAFFNVGNAVLAQCGMIIGCVYPIFGPYYVLMSNTDYRNSVNGFLHRVRNIAIVPELTT